MTSGRVQLASHEHPSIWDALAEESIVEFPRGRSARPAGGMGYQRHGLACGGGAHGASAGACRSTQNSFPSGSFITRKSGDSSKSEARVAPTERALAIVASASSVAR